MNLLIKNFSILDCASGYDTYDMSQMGGANCEF